MKVKTLDKQSIFLLQNRKNRLNIISNSLFNINELHCQFIKLIRDKQKYSIDQVHLILWQCEILIEKT